MQGPWDGTIPQDYYAYAQGRESGGDDSATNSRSSATGRYQFIDGTWNNLMQKHPELGLTADGRTDADQSTRAMHAFTQDNAQSLSAAGVPINSHSLYLAHRFGVGGALKVLGADPSTPVGSVLPNVIAANPDLRGKSVADIMGGKAMGYASNDDGGALSANSTIGSGVLAAAPGRGAASQQPNGGLENGLMGAAAALASVYSPQQGAVLAGLRKDPTANDYTFSTLPNGQIARFSKTGKAEILPGNFAKPDANEEKIDPKVLIGLSEDWGGKYGALQNTAERASKFEDMLRNKQIDLSVLARGKAAIESTFGKSSPQTQAYNDFQAFRTQMANDSLRLNKGVQTEGDAARAREELATAFGSNDPATMANALHNFVDKTGKVMSSSAKSQLDSYSSAYKNQAPFAPYYDRLKQQQGFYDEYAKNHPGLMPAAPAATAPANRPPLASFNR